MFTLPDLRCKQDDFGRTLPDFTGRSGSGPLSCPAITLMRKDGDKKRSGPAALPCAIERGKTNATHCDEDSGEDHVELIPWPTGATSVRIPAPPGRARTSRRGPRSEEAALPPVSGLTAMRVNEQRPLGETAWKVGTRCLVVRVKDVVSSSASPSSLIRRILTWPTPPFSVIHDCGADIRMTPLRVVPIRSSLVIR
jgi:hypothetical protein